MVVNSKNKGGNFERKICKELSLWWTDNKSSDIFWRSASSGAMATQRAKNKQTAFGQYGDIQATNPEGQSLIDACTLELKVGYGEWGLIEVMDGNGKNYMIQQFMDQVFTDHKKAGSRWPVIIAKRDRRKPIIIFPIVMTNMIAKEYGVLSQKKDDIDIGITFSLKKQAGKGMTMMLLEDFFYFCDPEFFKSGKWKEGWKKETPEKPKRTRG